MDHYGTLETFKKNIETYLDVYNYRIGKGRHKYNIKSSGDIFDKKIILVVDINPNPVIKWSKHCDKYGNKKIYMICEPTMYDRFLEHMRYINEKIFLTIEEPCYFNLEKEKKIKIRIKRNDKGKIPDLILDEPFSDGNIYRTDIAFLDKVINKTSQYCYNTIGFNLYKLTRKIGNHKLKYRLMLTNYILRE